MCSTRTVSLQNIHEHRLWKLKMHPDDTLENCIGSVTFLHTVVKTMCQ